MSIDVKLFMYTLKKNCELKFFQDLFWLKYENVRFDLNKFKNTKLTKIDKNIDKNTKTSNVKNT